MDERFATILKVFYEISGCAGQLELASWLNVTQAAISDARRQQRIPVTWLAVACCKTGMRPAEIMEKMDVLTFKYMYF